MTGEWGRCWSGGTAEAAGARPRRQVRTPPPRRVPSGPRLRHGEWAYPGSRGFFVHGRDRGRGEGWHQNAHTSAPGATLALSSAPSRGVGASIWGDAVEMDGESRRPKTILWLLSPAPILSRGFAGVVLLELTAPGLRAVAEQGHQ